MADIIQTHSRRQPPPRSRRLSPSSAVHYVLQEQRVLCLLIGVGLSAIMFTFGPSTGAGIAAAGSAAQSATPIIPRRVMYETSQTSQHAVNAGMKSRTLFCGRIPMELKRKGLRILVTGGAGFVGSHLVDRLIARGDSVIVIDNFFTGRKENLLQHFGNPRFELIRHDVVEPILLELPDHKTNVMGTLNMLGLAKRVGARFLLTSTSEVYGDPLEHPQTETYWGNVNPIGVRSCYDEGKRTAETLTMDYHRGLNIEVVSSACLCPCVPETTKALRKESMTVYGDGKQTRSFQLMEGDHVGPFNLGNPGEFTMLELAKVVQDTIDPNAKIEFKPNTEDDPHKRKPDITRAKQHLGWEPTISLREGLPLMVSDFRKRIFGDEKFVSGVDTQ
nr:UDP-glucuronic acid decarboxylase 4-like [Ipomoea batatas]